MPQFFYIAMMRISEVWDYMRVAVDILLVAVLFYYVYRFLSHTKAVQLLKGLIAIFIFSVISNKLQLDTINWIITNLTSYLVLAVIVLFQPELRRLISQFAQRSWLSASFSEDALQLDELVSAVISMSEEKTGSLIVIERNSGLRNYIESGVAVNAGISEELIYRELDKISNDDLEDTAYNLALKKYGILRNKENDKYKLYQKLTRYLIGRGYGYDLVSRVVKKIINEE